MSAAELGKLKWQLRQQPSAKAVRLISHFLVCLLACNNILWTLQLELFVISLRSTCSWKIHRTQTQRLCKVLTRPSQTILVCSCNPPASLISLLIFMSRLRQIPELVHFVVLHTPATSCLCMYVCLYVMRVCMHLLLLACWTTYFTHTPTVRGVLNFLLRTKYYEESPDYQGMNSQNEMAVKEMRQTSCRIRIN